MELVHSIRVMRQADNHHEKKNVMVEETQCFCDPSRSNYTCCSVCKKQKAIQSFRNEKYVSLSKHDEKVPIDILRNTGATQSLLVDGTVKPV